MQEQGLRLNGRSYPEGCEGPGQLQGNIKAIGVWSPFLYIYVCVMYRQSHSSLLCRQSRFCGPIIRCKGLIDSFLTWEVRRGGQGAEMEWKGGRESPAGLCFLVLLSLRRMASASLWHNPPGGGSQALPQVQSSKPGLPMLQQGQGPWLLLLRCTQEMSC